MIQAGIKRQHPIELNSAGNNVKMQAASHNEFDEDYDDSVLENFDADAFVRQKQMKETNTTVSRSDAGKLPWPQQKNKTTKIDRDQSSRRTEKSKKKKLPAVHRPGALFCILGFKGRGETVNLSLGMKKAVTHIQKNYVVPRDFETSQKFGPHSGTCFEERLVAAYMHDQLKCRCRRIPRICYECGVLGHDAKDCASLL